MLQKVRSGTSKATFAVIAPVAKATVPPKMMSTPVWHDEARQEARDDRESRSGSAGAHAKGVDLLGDHHRPDLGRDPRADARREHQPAERGGEVAHEELEVRGAEHRVVANDAADLDASLVGQYHPDEAERDRDEEERAVADREHLLGDGALVAAAPEDVVERPDERPR